jgi:hypothetical protein
MSPERTHLDKFKEDRKKNIITLIL